MTNANPSAVYFGGVPTEPEVRALREAFPESDLEPGRVIPYGEVEAVISARRGESRFETVTRHWRKIVERETGRIVIDPIPGIAFKVLSEVEKIDKGNGKLASAVRSSRRAYMLTSRVETAKLPEEEKARLLSLQKRSAALISTAQIKSTASLPTIGEA